MASRAAPRKVGGMTVTEALQKRRAIKHYDPDFVIPTADIKDLFAKTLLTPSSFNLQHWRFAAVVDPAVKIRLCQAAWGQRHIREASMVVVLAGNLEAPADAADIWEHTPDQVREKLVPQIEGFYSENAQLKRDEAVRSVSLAAMSLMLAATEMGYATCPMIGFDPKAAAEIVRMPQNWIPVMMITVGRGIREPHPKLGQLRVEDVVFWNFFDGEPIR